MKKYNVTGMSCAACSARVEKAVKGIPQAVLKLKGVCDEMPCVAEQVKVILSSGVSVEECFSAE